ncbi:MAG TPA: CocE/NonD family hydrolase [Steroidobacteraceae bacterium]|jgi:putative CocE/NonD family hydrolase|nr:CocE/NonD family hydrolase [Steroidobacteraceae bacterium]
MPSAKSFVLFVLLALAPFTVLAQDLEFHPPQSATDPNLPKVMRDLAGRVLPVYQDSDQDRFLTNLSALQLVAGDYPSAAATRQALRDRRGGRFGGGRTALYDIYARARAIERAQKIPFAQAYTQAYREIVPRLNDFDEFQLTKWFGVPLETLQENLQRALDQHRAKGSVTVQQAIDLVWTYLAFEAFRNFGPLVPELDAQEDRRRYTTEENVPIETPDGATLSATIVRAKSAKPLPALIEFSLYVSQNDARESAARGYVGVVAYARGVYGSKDKPMLFEHDGEDARAVIKWVSEQSWSDGRVAIYGSNYSGFVAWAAAKKLPSALKAIATTDPLAPGIDVPMTGNIFRNSAYRWAFQVTNPGSGDERLNSDEAWRAFQRDWYKSGRRYREFAGMFGSHSQLFRRWLGHPSYDSFWQRMIPFREQFAHIDIPVLTTTGYYADGEVGALYYFSQHLRYDPHANHTLLIGPYDEGVMRRGVSPTLRGYTLDPVANVDLHELRYQWLDFVLKQAKAPALLKDRVNYQLMGANEWRHVPSIDAMSNGTLRYYLEEDPASDRNRLVTKKVSDKDFLPQTFDLADRTDADWTPPTEIVTRAIKPHNGEMFVSEPMSQPTELSGLLTGRLDFTVNKMDMDLYVQLYEQLPSGEYVKLCDDYEFRASYVKDRTRRHLLRAGVRQQLSFKSERLTARRLQAGSRIVIVLGIVKRPDRQINYGTGDDVSEESIEDARVPVKIRWYGSSYIDVPIRR